MARIGETKCWNPRCGCTDAAVHRTAGGKLSIQCHKCGAAPWAAQGTKAYRDLMAVTTLDDDDDSGPAPAVSPAPEPATKPAPAKKAGVFSGLMLS